MNGTTPAAPGEPDPAEIEPTDNSTGVAPDAEQVHKAEEEALEQEHREGR